MKKVYIVGIALVLVILNAWILFHLRKPRPRVDGLTEAAIAYEEQEDQRKDRVIATVAEWSEETSVPFNAVDLPNQVGEIPWEQCGARDVGIPLLSKSDLNEEQVTDLNLAITGLLRAYSTDSPDAVLNYMRDRHKEFDPTVRLAFESALRRLGQQEISGLSNEELFSQYWAVNRCRSGWSAFKPGVSCRQIWDGRGLSIEAIRSFGVDGEKRGPAWEIIGDFKGTMTLGHSFRSVKGSIENELNGPERLLIADVKIVIEYDERLFNGKAPYLVRFWHNREIQRWQPIAMLAFGSGVERKIIPKLQF